MSSKRILGKWLSLVQVPGPSHVPVIPAPPAVLLSSVSESGMASLFAEEWVVGPQGTKFYTRKYEPPTGIANAKAVLLFTHGFAEHIARYSHVFPVWASSDIAVLSFDQRGFGRTATGDKGPTVPKDTQFGRTSMKEHTQDLAFFITKCEEWIGGATGTEGAASAGPVPLFLGGHSMGGLEVLEFVCGPERKKDVAKLAGAIVLSPLIHVTHPPATIKRQALSAVAVLLPWMSIDPGVDAAQLSRDPDVVREYVADPLVTKTGTLRGIKTMLDTGDAMFKSKGRLFPPQLPVFWAHGTVDEINSYSSSKAVYDGIRSKDKTFSEFEGGFHELLNEPHPVKERLMGEVADWILARAIVKAKL